MMKNIKSLLSMIKKVYYILDKKQRIEAVKVLINIFISSCLETLSIGAIVPFVMAIMNPQKVWANQYASYICEILKIKTDMQLLVAMGLALVLLYLVKNIYLILSGYIQAKFRYELQNKLTLKMMADYLKRSYSYFINTNSAQILQSVGGDVGLVKDTVNTLCKLITYLTNLIMIGVYLIYTDYVLAIGILFLSAIGVMFMTYGFKSKVKFLGVKQRDMNAANSKALYETIGGIKEIIVMRRQKVFLNTCERINAETCKYNILYETIQGCPNRIMEIIFILGLIIMICVRLSSGVDVNAFVPQFAAFAMGGMKVLPSLSNISASLTSLVFYKAGVDALYQNLKEAENYEQERKLYINENNYMGKDYDCIEKFENLQINNIWWRYDNTTLDVLKGLSFNIKEGEAIALIGESGAGKTTVVDIILGLFKPLQGGIYIDGIDIFSIPETWSNLIAYVPQTVFLMDTTIKQNIAFELAEEQIDEERVWDVLEQAQLKEFIMSQPDKLNTLVGERGVRFSGGQRQRLAIARALYRNPKILVLDEATAALDNETEEAVMEAIEALQGKITLIIVAHRLTTVRICDKIYEIKDGRAYLRNKEEILA